MTTNKYYERLKEIKDKYPDLTFDNDGYEYIPEKLKAHKDVVGEISDILKKTVEGFVRFNNFKPRKDGSFDVRMQCYYDGASGFIGVRYTPIDKFKNFME